MRNIATAAGTFRSAIAEAVKPLQQQDSLDAAIFCATDDTIIWWDHSPTAPTERVAFFDALADRAYSAVPRLLRVPIELTEPYSGLSLNAEGDFVNLSFPRL